MEAINRNDAALWRHTVHESIRASGVSTTAAFISADYILLCDSSKNVSIFPPVMDHTALY